MERVRQLHEFWAWLPAFRVVAETEHLPTASHELGVTPQALSRSIKLLEQHVGRPLFRRVGRRIQLSDDGRQFLDRVRDAMRGIDEGLLALRNEQLTGPVHIAALAHHAWIFVEPALARVREQQPGLIPHVLSVSGRAAQDQLRRGTLDVVVGEQFDEDDAITVTLLCELTYGVYCGAAHPLFRRRRLNPDELTAHAFVVPEASFSDGWPPSDPRKIGARVSSFQLALDLVWSGQLLAFLPDIVETADPWRRSLHRLPTSHHAARPIYIATRRAVGPHGRTRIVVAALESVAKQLMSARRK